MPASVVRDCQLSVTNLSRSLQFVTRTFTPGAVSRELIRIILLCLRSDSRHIIVPGFLLLAVILVLPNIVFYYIWYCL